MESSSTTSKVVSATERSMLRMMYRELDSDFRLRYAEMWRSLVMGDGPGIEAAARALGVGDHYPLFSAILTQRCWHGGVL